MASETSYDYILVGAGIGGLVLANRLSEDPNVSVLLVEAGPNHMGDPLIDTPGFVGELCGKPEYDWDYMTEPQTHANNRQIGQPRGRMVGGSSAMNFSMVLYPLTSDFAAWESLGNHGWGPENMAPYLRKFHTYTPPSETTTRLLGTDRYIHPQDHGTDGPVPVTFPEVHGEFNAAWEATFEQMGWRNDVDPITGRKIGAFTPLMSVDGKAGRRGYAAAYYSPEVAARPNLTLLTDTMVRRVLLKKADDGDVVATGIEVHGTDGVSREIAATREVILCGGTLNSPQLLELSGIGDANVLSRHDIPVVIDLPGVGENLQDHGMPTVSFEVADGHPTGDSMRDPSVLKAALELYEKTRGGPLAGAAASMAYMPLVDHNGQVPSDEIKDLLNQHLDQPGSEQLPPGRRRQYDILRRRLLVNEEATSQYIMYPVQATINPGATSMKELLTPSRPGNYISFLVMQNHPFSRGSVHVRSADPHDKPVYDPKYLSHPLDLEILVRHTQFMEKIATTGPLAALLKPGARVPASAVDLTDLDQAKEVVKERLYHCFHPTGTCAMMPEEANGVVDARLKVYGTRNLRVVDASIIPMEPAGNIQATTYAVAERAADLIRRS